MHVNYVLPQVQESRITKRNRERNREREDMKKIKKVKKKEVKTDKLMIGLIIILVIFISSATFGLNQLRNRYRPYSYEEMLHDHDGDGIPDHPVDFH